MDASMDRNRVQNLVKRTGGLDSSMTVEAETMQTSCDSLDFLSQLDVLPFMSKAKPATTPENMLLKVVECDHHVRFWIMLRNRQFYE